MAKSIPEVKIGNEVYQVKDRTAREHLVEVSQTQPTSEDNKLWIKNQEAEYEVPTIDEFNDLKSALEVTAFDLSDVTSFLEPIVLELGSINTNTGAYVDSSDGTRLRTNMHIPCKPNTTYNFLFTNNSGNSLAGAYCFYTKDHTYIDSFSFTTSGTSSTGTRKSPATAGFIAIRFNGTGMTPSNVAVSAYTYDTQKYNTLIHAGTIASPGLDLNTGDFIRAGMWAFNNMDNAPSNYPTGATFGRIISFASNTDSSFATAQMVVDNNNKIFTRYSSSNGTWREWKEIARKEDLDLLDSLALKNKGNIETASLDLDIGDFIHPGMWALANMTYKPDHYPSEVIGRIVSFASNSNSSFATVQMVVDKNGSIFMRSSWSNGAWTKWAFLNESNNPDYLEPFSVLPNETKPYVYTGEITDYIGTTVTENPTRSERLYALYDALVEQYPDYIRKATPIGQDAAGNDINLYIIEPYQNCGYPEILWISNVHGNEPACAMATYYACKEILEKKFTDERIGTIFNSVRLFVVPCANPYGYDNNIRDNANGVNINRDFPVNWEYLNEPLEKTGTTSMSQPETQAIMTLVEGHRDNTLLVMNRHDTGDFVSHKDRAEWWHFVGYMVSLRLSVFDAMKSISKSMDAIARGQIGTWLFANSPYSGWKNLPMYPIRHIGSATNGTLDDYVNYIGVPSMLLEQCAAAGSDFTDPTEKRNELLKLSISITINVMLCAILNNGGILTDNVLSREYNGYTGVEEGGEIVRTLLTYNKATGTWSIAE